MVTCWLYKSDSVRTASILIFSRFFHRTDMSILKVWHFWAVISLCGVSLAINVLQGRQIHDLQVALRSPRESRTLVRVGSRVPSLRVFDEDERELRIDFAAASVPTILYVFSPSCSWCQRNGRSLLEVYRQT